MPVQLILPDTPKIKKAAYELEGREERTNYHVNTDEILAILDEAGFGNMQEVLEEERDDMTAYTIYVKM